ncbi:MAG: Gfo/Idh/MocA family oxidoreductase, partial [Armatimonadota bacterium]|nr:Gfo/Idh/MocA family oxidoreductase [Armatimonadota bacterium]
NVSGAGKPDRFSAEIAHFLRCVRGDEAPMCTPADGLRVQEVMDAVYRAAENAVWVECGP